MRTENFVSMKSNRPMSVTMMTIMVFIVTVVNVSRFILAITRWDILSEFLPFSPAYLALSGLIWGLVGLPLCWGIWRAKIWAPPVAGVVLLVYSAYYWLDRTLLAGFDSRNVNWSFAVIVNCLILVWSACVLSRTGVKEYFGARNEQ